MTNELSEESRPNTFPLMPPVAVAPSSGVIHTPGVSAVSFTPFLISRLDSRAPYVSFRLLPRSTDVSLVIACGAWRRLRRKAYRSDRLRSVALVGSLVRGWSLT